MSSVYGPALLKPPTIEDNVDEAIGKRNTYEKTNGEFETAHDRAKRIRRERREQSKKDLEDSKKNQMSKAINSLLSDKEGKKANAAAAAASAMAAAAAAAGSGGFLSFGPSPPAASAAAGVSAGPEGPAGPPVGPRGPPKGVAGPPAGPAGPPVGPAGPSVGPAGPPAGPAGPPVGPVGPTAAAGVDVGPSSGPPVGATHAAESPVEEGAADADGVPEVLAVSPAPRPRGPMRPSAEDRPQVTPSTAGEASASSSAAASARPAPEAAGVAVTQVKLGYLDILKDQKRVSWDQLKKNLSEVSFAEKGVPGSKEFDDYAAKLDKDRKEKLGQQESDTKRLLKHMNKGKHKKDKKKKKEKGIKRTADGAVLANSTDDESSGEDTLVARYKKKE
eukprot:TRINITY_DN75887_c0_g1_i1.p1 TRINITY_DN75887_c0_g1~~TRINITY_DN75887_c0_g1_i1.p1  ORF type:complete len:390 (-),score=108.90 TRINITY_DN75887_c0_g1_i1:65-1234(-)